MKRRLSELLNAGLILLGILSAAMELKGFLLPSNFIERHDHRRDRKDRREISYELEFSASSAFSAVSVVEVMKR